MQKRDGETRKVETFYAHEELHSVGIGPGSSDFWDDYTDISPTFREMLKSLYTPSAYKALHYHPNTFKHIFKLPGMSFDGLEIFRLELGFFVQKTSDADRSPYFPIFEACKLMVRDIHRNMLRNLVARRKDDINLFVNMGIACETTIELDPDQGMAASGTRRSRHRMLRGFFPYFCNHSLALHEIMFFFTCSHTDRIALVTAPDSEREAAIAFVRAHGVMQFFDKVCACCGKTGNDLFKCPCKAVRYCCSECQRTQWPLHKTVCALHRAGSTPEK